MIRLNDIGDTTFYENIKSEEGLPDEKINVITKAG